MPISTLRGYPRIGGVIGYGPVGGKGAWKLQERYALADDFYDDVSLLLKMNGSNGSTTFLDSSKHGHTVTVNGDSQISTTQSKFGGSSAYFDGSGDYLSIPSTATLGFGSGDFTVEFWFYAANFTATTRPLANNVFVINIDANITDNLGSIRFYDSASNFSVANVVPSGQWSHIALVRSGTTARIFVNGQEVHSFTHTRSLGTPATSYIAANPQFTTSSACYIDDLRVTKGQARYTAAFTPPQRGFLP